MSLNLKQATRNLVILVIEIKNNYNLIKVLATSKIIIIFILEKNANAGSFQQYLSFKSTLNLRLVLDWSHQLKIKFLIFGGKMIVQNPLPSLYSEMRITNIKKFTKGQINLRLYLITDNILWIDQLEIKPFYKMK